MSNKENNIQPAQINSTEERILILLLNLVKYPKGLTLDSIKKLMSNYYNNPNEESDQKKITRDISSLEDLGFNIRFLIDDYLGNTNVYRLEFDELEKKLQFGDDELETLSVLLLDAIKNDPSVELITLSQKIFKNNIQFFPNFTQSNFQEPENQQIETIFFSILEAVKNQSPLKIYYNKTNIDSKLEEREIEPFLIIKRNQLDYYLLAYDRKKKANRRFIIPKIKRIIEIGGEFIKQHSPSEKDLNYHPLAYSIHDPIEVSFECEPNLVYKLKNFLYPHPFIENQQIITTTITYNEPIFNFIIKENDVVLKVYPEIFLKSFEIYLHSYQKQYL
jgi:predicted DNA-binding transcriptional regulator YafY